MELLHGLFPRHIVIRPSWMALQGISSLLSILLLFYFHCKFQVFFVCMEDRKEIPRGAGKGGVWGLFLWDFFLSFTSLSALELTLLKSLTSLLCHFLLCYFLQRNLRIRKYLFFFIFPSFLCPFTSHFYRSPWVMILVWNSNNLPYPSFKYPQGLEPVSKTYNNHHNRHCYPIRTAETALRTLRVCTSK